MKNPPRNANSVAARPDWVLVFEDETWRSRVVETGVHAWIDAAPLRLVDQAVPQGEPKELAGDEVVVRACTLVHHSILYSVI